MGLGGDRQRVGLPQDRDAHEEDLAVEADGFGQVSRRVVGLGEVVAGREELDVPRAESALRGAVGRLQQREGPVRVSRLPVGESQVGGRLQGLGVVLPSVRP